MILILTLLSLIFVVLTLWWCSKLYIFYVKLKKFAGPTPLPIIGNAHFFRNGSDVIKNFLYYQNKYGGMYKLMLGENCKLVITDYKAAETILGSTAVLNKAYEYKFLIPWLGTGLLTSKAEKWRVHRKLITPTFHFKILDEFIDIFNNQTAVLVKQLEKNLDGNPFDVFPYVSATALDVVCETAMGVSVNAQTNSDSKYVRSVKEMSHLLASRMFSPLKFNDTIYSLGDDFKKEKEVLSVLHGFTNSVIQERHNELSNSKGNAKSHIQDQSDDIGAKKKIAFLDLLLQCKVNNKPLSDEDIRNEVDTFMFEGHDTVTAGISFALFCLGQNQNIQEKVVEELLTIFSDDKSRTATHVDFQNMKYMDMVIKESMRIYPPVTWFARGITNEVPFGNIYFLNYFDEFLNFNKNDTTLPVGLSLIFFVHGLHKDPEIYPDPDKFDPERFSAENASKRPLYAYLPFSAGSRNCIGQRYAYLIMKSIISSILRNYQVLPVENFTPELVFDIILHSTNGVLLKLKKRSF